MLTGLPYTQYIFYKSFLQEIITEVIYYRSFIQNYYKLESSVYAGLRAIYTDYRSSLR